MVPATTTYTVRRAIYLTAPSYNVAGDTCQPAAVWALVIWFSCLPTTYVVYLCLVSFCLNTCQHITMPALPQQLFLPCLLYCLPCVFPSCHRLHFLLLCMAGMTCHGLA